MKPIVNPSRLSDFYSCRLLYNDRYNLHLVRPSKLDPKPTLGTLLHVTQAADEVGAPWRSALQAEIKKFQTSLHYTTEQSRTLEQLQREAILIHGGGSFLNGRSQKQTIESYESWRKTNLQGITIEAVEKRVFVDVGPLVIAPQFDFIASRTNPVSGSEEWFVCEWKTTARDDSAWDLRWQLDGQTTLQVLAAERYFDREFVGVFVLKTLINRQQPKEWNNPWPPPLSSVSREEPRWVYKKASSKALYESLLEQFPKDLANCESSGIWPPDGMHNRHCDFCDEKLICAGKETRAALVPRPPDDIDRFVKEKRR